MYNIILTQAPNEQYMFNEVKSVFQLVMCILQKIVTGDDREAVLRDGG